MTGSRYFLGLLIPEPGCVCPYPKNISWGNVVELPAGKVTHLMSECQKCHHRLQVPVEALILCPVTMKPDGSLEVTK